MEQAKRMFFFTLVIISFCITTNTVLATEIAPLPAEGVQLPTVDINIGTSNAPEDINRSLQILLFMTLITLSPYLLIMLTSFTRIVITLHFLRTAMGTQQMPPNQIMIGLALFLTLFVMGPTVTQIKDEALTPYNNGEVTQTEAFTTAMKPIRDFMFRQAEPKDIALFGELAQIDMYNTYGTYDEVVEELPNSVLIPAFLLGELTKGFKIGVVLYIPFIVIDMVVASTLMAMGMMMLPPAMISLPFKILFFVMVDGWELVIQGILMTFY